MHPNSPPYEHINSHSRYIWPYLWLPKLVCQDCHPVDRSAGLHNSKERVSGAGSSWEPGREGEDLVGWIRAPGEPGTPLHLEVLLQLLGRDGVVHVANVDGPLVHLLLGSDVCSRSACCCCCCCCGSLALDTRLQHML